MEPIIGLALSVHLGFNDVYNAVHPHFGFRNENVIIGTFFNSEEELSFYGGFRSEFNNIGVEYGLTTGYYELGNVIPMLRLTYDIDENVRTFISPSVESTKDGRVDPGLVVGVEIIKKFRR